jgi:AmmeMemoRadiSam system protein A
MLIDDADKATLFRLARGSIQACLTGTAPPELAAVPPALQEPYGVFVTLRQKGRLRGCIGYLEAVKPLAQAVQEMALAAAIQDPRFPPVRPEELPEIDLEISVLSPMRRINAIEEIRVGTHGLYVERGGCRGLLLPQVAAECGWDRTTFLQQTCAKACLPANAWQDPATRIFVFTAEILKEPPLSEATPRQESKSP